MATPVRFDVKLLVGVWITKQKLPSAVSENLWWELPVMKLLPNFCVLLGEDKAKLYAAERHNDDDRAQTTAPPGRSPEPFPGANRGTPPALEFRRAFAPGPTATGFF